MSRCKCKTAAFAKSEFLKPGKCSKKTTNFLCRLCRHKEKKYYVHDDSGDYLGFSYECANCREFVRYKVKDKTIKEEFYIEELEDICVCIDKKNVYIINFIKNNSDSLIFPKFLVKNKQQFLTKIKTMLLFS